MRFNKFFLRIVFVLYAKTHTKYKVEEAKRRAASLTEDKYYALVFRFGKDFNGLYNTTEETYDRCMKAITELQDILGVLNALASICLTLSLVTWRTAPTSSNVCALINSFWIELQKISAGPVSLATPAHEDSDDEMVDFVKDEAAISPELNGIQPFPTSI